MSEEKILADILKKTKRECGECVSCCDGTLRGEVHGKAFGIGIPCHFLDKCASKKCTIYEDRPQHPCKDYKCAWLMDDGQIFPPWMRPDQCGVVIDQREWLPGKAYLHITEGTKPIDSKILMWIIKELHMKHGGNLLISVHKSLVVLGSTEFMEWKRKNQDDHNINTLIEQ